MNHLCQAITSHLLMHDVSYAVIQTLTMVNHTYLNPFKILIRDFLAKRVLHPNAQAFQTFQTFW